MQWIVGSESERKVNTVRKVVAQVTGKTDFTIVGYGANSGVGNTPYDKETYIGAENRANECKHKFPQADYWVGLESGLVERYGHLYEEAWACVIARDAGTYYGFSSGLKVPDCIIRRMQETQREHWQVMPQLRDELGVNTGKDTWANYTGDMLIREISLEEALRNALVQRFAPEHAFYHL